MSTPQKKVMIVIATLVANMGGSTRTVDYHLVPKNMVNNAITEMRDNMVAQLSAGDTLSRLYLQAMGPDKFIELMGYTIEVKLLGQPIEITDEESVRSWLNNWEDDESKTPRPTEWYTKGAIASMNHGQLLDAVADMVFVLAHAAEVAADADTAAKQAALANVAGSD